MAAVYLAMPLLLIRGMSGAGLLQARGPEPAGRDLMDTEWMLDGGWMDL